MVTREADSMKFPLRHDILEADGFALFVGQLYADNRFAGYGRNAHAECFQGKGQIVLQVYDALQLDAGRGLEFKAGNDRAGADFDDHALHAEVGKLAARGFRHRGAAPHDL